MKKSIGLALGSGGWRGLAHIGVIKSLVTHGYVIDAIAGSSAGALIGGLYALEADIEKVEAIFSKLTYKDLLFALSDPTNGLGLFKGDHTLKLFQKYTQNAYIENLPIPFAAIASDMITGKTVILNHGDLAQAIRISSSIPMIFEPVKTADSYLVDGGMINPIPVAEVKKLGAQIVVGVNVYQSIFPITKPLGKLSKLDFAIISYQLMLNQLANRDGEAADIYLCPELEDAQPEPLTRFINNSAAIAAGERAMDNQIDQLNRLVS